MIYIIGGRSFPSRKNRNAVSDRRGLSGAQGLSNQLGDHCAKGYTPLSGEDADLGQYLRVKVQGGSHEPRV